MAIYDPITSHWTELNTSLSKHWKNCKNSQVGKACCMMRNKQNFIFILYQSVNTSVEFPWALEC